MSDGKVTALFGGPTGEMEVHQGAVSVARDALELCESGEVVGIGVVLLYRDRLSGFRLGGLVGSYSMIGATTMLQDAIVDVTRDE